MSFLIETLSNAITLILSPSSEIWPIVGLSFLVASVAIGLAVILGAPLGALLALKIFPGRHQAATLLQGTMGFPPILIGLLVSLFLWPQEGPLRNLNLFQTPVALIITQTLIVLPIITGFIMAAIKQLNPNLILQFKALGASHHQLLGLILWETRFTLLGAILVSCGRVLSEVGATWMTGGNIPGYTQVMATAIAGEVSQGNLVTAVSLGMILLMTVTGLCLILAIINRREKKHEYSH
ncbi:MAG: ABC transporter permease [Clostridia bacterium]|nr:ABC transporter permease [Clostridia bacterium]